MNIYGHITNEEKIAKNMNKIILIIVNIVKSEEGFLHDVVTIIFEKEDY